jgi:hypothetical protein
MHKALAAMQKYRDGRLIAIGFDRALRMGFLGQYLAMMNRGGSGGYDPRLIVLAKMHPGVDVVRPAKRKAA